MKEKLSAILGLMPKTSRAEIEALTNELGLVVQSVQRKPADQKEGSLFTSNLWRTAS